MRWINKRNKKNRKKGHAIVNRFLRNGWNKDFGKYVNGFYCDLQREGKIVRLLLREQEGLCCYCMRHISYKNHTTLEHVLPRKTAGNDYSSIIYYLNSARFMKRYVRWSEEPPKKHVHVPPYPHYCAYENLVASCDGSIVDVNKPEECYPGKLHNSCNNFRESDRIVPIFYDFHAKDLICYEPDGELTYDEDLYEETIKAVNLEYPTLKLMRKAWAEICLRHTPEDVKRAQNDNALKQEIIDEMDLDVFDSHLMTYPNIWNLFYEYRWFYTYFKEKFSKS